ncbi:LPXTG cell wall anchor domain-containing protein (plasmid) [Enterococcus faecalis]|uniref:LPXTG cell wall anchor domain-containing protein n=1 Tax=Enterococcus faecalis TaxID=1351 RepID=UPI0029C93810|nr:LPXTG cell wall anchor domain-containing protein [Enterococcus faecalis]WPH48349.1 LPXTG cell wall anchor domain-containing protein [Enterococcus faecalis]
MKKIILASLFSGTLLFGSFSPVAFAEEVIPTDPSTPPIEVPTDPSEPEEPTEPTDPSVPVDPENPPVTPEEPTDPSEPEEPTEPTNPSTPEEPTNPSEPEEPTEPTNPSEPEEPTEPTNPSTPEEPAEPETPTTPTQPNVPKEPEKPIDVVVTPDGEISTTEDNSQQPTVPIETTNVQEITHVPTANTPIITESGESIIAVKDGVPLTQTENGLTPIHSNYTVLPSGNVKVKGNDGKMKVLPHTGEEMNILLSLVGGIFSSVSGFILLKKRN